MVTDFKNKYEENEILKQNLCCLRWYAGSPNITNLWVNFYEPVLQSTANRFAVHHLNRELCDYVSNDQ